MFSRSASAPPFISAFDAASPDGDELAELSTSASGEVASGDPPEIGGSNSSGASVAAA
jgi:hypothetical protein